MGVGALIGASIKAGISIYKKRKELGKKFVLQYERIIDTVWQSTGAGVAFAMALGASTGGILEFIFALLAGAGINSLCDGIGFPNLLTKVYPYFKKKGKKSKK